MSTRSRVLKVSAELDMSCEVVEAGLTLQTSLGGACICLIAVRLKRMHRPFLPGSENLGAGSAALRGLLCLCDFGRDWGTRKPKLTAEKTRVIRSKLEAAAGSFFPGLKAPVV